MILNDLQIREMASEGMIGPFKPTLVRKPDDGAPALSFGLSGYG